MRIKELFTILRSTEAGFLRTWGPFILNFLITVLGFLSAYSVFQFLSANGLEHAQKQASADTVIVKLVDLPKFNTSSIGHSDTSKIQANKSGVRPEDTASTPSDQFSNAFQPHFKPALQVTEDMKKTATALYQLNQHDYPWWILLAFTLLTFMAVLYVLYYNLPFYSLEMRKDIDPKNLTQLLNSYSTQIQSLGNPRKIKRLSNKIRFQYYYLENKNLADTANLKKLFDILLLFEKQNILAPLDLKTSNQIISNQQSFNDFLVQNKITLGSEQFMRIMFSLNRDSFF